VPNVSNVTDREGAPEPDAHSGPTEESQPVRRVLVFTIVALALLMMSVDSTIVATALDSLREGLHTSINWVAWTITAYSFGFVLIVPVSGILSERYGRRKVFVASVVAFTIASLCCGLAGNIYVLIALRAIQAAGGAGFTPSATGIIVNHFGETRDRAVSLFGSIFQTGAMIGPIFGGLFVSYWSWRGIFFINVPIGAAVIVLALRFIPRDRPRAGPPLPRMDVTGMALLGSALLAGMIAAGYLGEGDAHVWSPVFVAPIIVAIVAAWLFFRHIDWSPDPFIPPRFIRGPSFGPVNLINGLYGGVTLGAIALVPLYAINRYGMNALDAGTVLAAQGGAAILLSIVTALTLRRTGYRLPLYLGAVVSVGGLLLLACAPVGGIPAYPWLAGSAFLVGVGSGVINPASRNAGLQLAPQNSSTIAALRSMCLQIGSIVTISIATSILASSADPGVVESRIYLVTALLLVAGLPLIARIPEHHGSW
jgi:MFS family permease